MWLQLKEKAEEQNISLSRGEESMGRFVNPDNSAFQDALQQCQVLN